MHRASLKSNTANQGLPTMARRPRAKDREKYLFSQLFNGESQHQWLRLAGLCTLLVLAAALYADLMTDTKSATVGLKYKAAIGRKMHSLLAENNDLVLTMEVALAERPDGIAGGPHRVFAQVKKKNCSFPRFWVRFTGAALLHVDLYQDASSLQTWSGLITFPKSGQYTIDARWYGCSSGDGMEFVTLPPSESMETLFVEVGRPAKRLDSLFTGNWVAATQKTWKGHHLPKYMWVDPSLPASNATYIPSSDSAVVREGTAGEPDGFFRFNELGNYELLCFMGSHTMQEIRREFLDLRPNLFPAQRPFKFHMYDIPSFLRPDRFWEEETKKRLRKCKHIVVSLDESVDPVSQAEYRDHVKNFIGHLLLVIPDETFPIWMFTVNEPPMKATNCHSPALPRSTDHPCNEVLRELFRSTSTFPSRVHLLDNTDLSLPQFDLNLNDVLAVIALRIYVLVGRGVSTWRDMGQQGLVDGLHRNDTVEPNIELVPYEGGDANLWTALNIDKLSFSFLLSAFNPTTFPVIL